MTRSEPNLRALALWAAAAEVAALLGIDPVLRVLVLLIALDLAAGLARPGLSLRPLLIGMTLAAVLAVLVNLLLSHTGDDVLFSLPDGLPGIGGAVTLEALAWGAVTALGLAASLAAVAVLALAAEPLQLVAALPRRMERLAVAVAAALTLVPALARSWTAVREAQRCRGWAPRRLRGWRHVVLPVTLTALEDSVQLAEALEARGYGGRRRTRLRPLGLRAPDIAVAAAALTAAALLVVARIGGDATDWYPFPSLSVPPAAWSSVLAAALLCVPVLVWRSPRSVA